MDYTTLPRLVTLVFIVKNNEKPLKDFSRGVISSDLIWDKLTEREWIIGWKRIQKGQIRHY